MRRLLQSRVLFALLAGAGLCESQAATLQQLHVRISMRDGVQLAANIFRPSAKGPFPTILLRTPYDKGAEITPNFQAFVDHGYAVVVQDVRGRYESEGTFSPLVQEGADGDDTLNWIAKQAWSDGGIGMTGGSYLGISQWKVAVLNNPHLKAIFPYVSGDEDYRDRFYSPGGAMKLGHRLLWVEENLRSPDYEPPAFGKFIWTVPLRRTDLVTTGRRSRMMQQVMNHPAYDEFWQALSVSKRLKELHVPVFSVGGWYDNYVESDLEAYSVLLKASKVNRIMVGPWAHNFTATFAGTDFGPEAHVPLRKQQIEWFDRWLKGKNARVPEAPVRIFVMGINLWRDENEWPLARAKEEKFYLLSGGHANSLSGDGVLVAWKPKTAVPDQFTFNPQDPVPTRGGSVCCNPAIFPWGPMDQRGVEKRPDVLVYTSGPLKEDMEVTGNIEMVLYAATTALDTDFTAKLVDVLPNGMARNLTDGILRARYRNSLSKPELMTPGQPYRLKIDVGVTSNVFRKDHRIRVEISSSNFPRFDRNPNTGRPIADETEFKPAVQTIYHDGRHASYLSLPVVPPRAPDVTTHTAYQNGAKRPGVRPGMRASAAPR